MTVVATLRGILRLDDSQFRATAQSAKNQMNTLGGQMRSVGSNMISMGATLSAAVAPVGIALGVAIDQTREFDRNMSNVNAILGITGGEARDLRAEILAYGSNTVAGPLAVSDAYYAIVSGVQDASTHMAILDAATRTSEAGQADLMATTSGLISVMNSYGFAADDAAYVSDVMTRTVQMGVLTMDELAASLPLVTGLASQFGIGVDEVAGNMAYLTTQGYEAAQSATFLKSMITTLLAPTTDVSTAIQALGYESGAAMLEAEGLAGAYQLLSEHNGGLDGLITNQEALTGALGLTQDAAAEFMTTYSSGIDGATERAGLIQGETDSWLRLQSQIQGLSIQIGSVLLPILSNMVENYISPAITAVSEWIAANPDLATTIMMIVGAVLLAGPVVFGLGMAVTAVGGFITATSGAAGLLAATFALLTGPMGMVIASIALMVWGLMGEEGGLIGSFNRAKTAAMQLATLGLIALHTAAQWVEDQLESLGIDVDDLRSKFEGLQTTWDQLGQLAGMVVSGEVSVGEIAQETVNQFTGHRSALRHRAGGGDVTAGMPYVVGEHEPEMFVPNVSGTILNQSQMAGMGGMQIGRVVIHANDYAGGQAAAQGFSDRLNELRRTRGIQAGA